MALIDRTPSRIARRFWHGWTRALPAHLVLGSLFTLAFLPIAATPLADTHGHIRPAVFVPTGLSLWLVFLSWAVSGLSARTGFALLDVLRALPRLLIRSLAALLLFALTLGGPLLGTAAAAGGIALSIAAGFLAFAFFLFLDWNALPTAPASAPAPQGRSFLATVVWALWEDVRGLAAFVRGAWARTPMALASMVAGFFVLSLILLPLTWILDLLWPHAPLWSGLFFAFVLFSSMPSVAAAALVEGRPAHSPKVA